MTPLDTTGGKVRGLLHLHRLGLPMPEWRVLPFDTVADRAWQHDEAFRAQLADVVSRLGGALAVRSSAENEDGARTSNAGQFHTAFADSQETLFAALDAVADSARGARIAIVLMRALSPTVAGVAFSADPACATLDRFYVEAVAGHGKHLVDGDATPIRLTDSLRGDCSTFGVPPLGGPEPEGVPSLEDRLKAELRTGDSELRDAIAPHVSALTHGLLLLEDALDAAVDVEWAIAGGTLYFLQARPMTALAAAPELRPASCHTSWFFDQRFLRPIAPFTRDTLIPRILRASLGSALAMRGHDPAKAQAFFYGGQAYVPHTVWRHMLDGTPRWFLSPDLRQVYPEHCACPTGAPCAGVVSYALDALRAVVRERREVFGNIGAWRTFSDALPCRIDAALALPDLAAQWRALDELNDGFLAVHRWSILWADYAYRVQVILGRLFGANTIEAALRVGMHLPTAEANAALARAMEHNESEDWERVLSEFGDRSASLDYATPTWREIYAPVRSSAFRRSSEFGENSHLPPGPPEGGTPNGGLLARCLGPIRQLLEMREEQRFHWEHILAAQRRLALEQATRWTDKGLIERPEDIWCLRGEEVFAAVSNPAALPTREALAARRHALRVETLIPKPLFLGPPEADAAQRAYRSQSPFTLQGVGASAGIIRGSAVHLSDPAQGLPPGAPRPCILIVRALDPGHTFLLREAAGIVAERGGLLSHAAILAREYRVPMVTALERAADLIPPGAEVEIDGQSGLVRLIGAPSPPGHK